MTPTLKSLMTEVQSLLRINKEADPIRSAFTYTIAVQSNSAINFSLALL